MARPKEELSCIGHVRPSISSSIREVGWTSTLRLEHVPCVQTWSDPCFPVRLQTVPPINGYGKQTPNNVTSMAVMEVTSESSELHNGRRSYCTNNCLKQALYKGSSRHFHYTWNSKKYWLCHRRILDSSPLILCLLFQDIQTALEIINARDFQPTDFLEFINF